MGDVLEFNLMPIEDTVMAMLMGIADVPHTDDHSLPKQASFVEPLHHKPLLIGSKIPYDGQRHRPDLLQRLEAIRIMTGHTNALDYFMRPGEHAPKLDPLDEIYAVSGLVKMTATLDPRIRDEPAGDNRILFVGADPLHLGLMQELHILTHDVWKQWVVGPVEHLYEVVHGTADVRPNARRYWAQSI